MENVNRIFSPLWAIYPSKPPLTLPDTPNKVILGSFGTRRLTTASFSHFYQLPKTSPPYIVDSLKNLLLRVLPVVIEFQTHTLRVHQFSLQNLLTHWRR